MKRGGTFEEAMKGAAARDERASDWNKVFPEQVPNYDALERVIEKLSGKRPKEIYKELGVSSRNDLSITAWDAFQQLKHVWAATEVNEE
jgi:hypothetical protein